MFSALAALCGFSAGMTAGILVHSHLLVRRRINTIRKHSQAARETVQAWRTDEPLNLIEQAAWDEIASQFAKRPQV